ERWPVCSAVSMAALHRRTAMTAGPRLHVSREYVPCRHENTRNKASVRAYAPGLSRCVNSVPSSVSIPKVHEILCVARLDLGGATALLEHLVFVRSLQHPESLAGSGEGSVHRARHPDLCRRAIEVQ